MDGLPAPQFEECVSETLFIKPVKGHFERHTRERLNPSHHILTINSVFESIDHEPPTFPTGYTQPSSTFSKTKAVIQMINRGRSPKPDVTRTHRVVVDWIVFESAFRSMCFDQKFVLTTNQLAHILTKGMFTTMQIENHCWLRDKVDDPMTQIMSAAFLANLPLTPLQEAPRDVSGDDTARESWSDMESIRINSIDWNQVTLWIIIGPWNNWVTMSFNVLKTRGILLQRCFYLQKSEEIVASWYFISNFQKPKGLWDNQLCTRHEFTSSYILFDPWEKLRWTSQKSSSQKDGMIISSNTRNLQGELMKKRFSSHPTLLARRRWTTCYSRNLSSSSSFYGHDERNSERRQSAVSARRGKKCSLFLEVQARILHVHWSRFGKDLELWKVSR